MKVVFIVIALAQFVVSDTFYPQDYYVPLKFDRIRIPRAVPSVEKKAAYYSRFGYGNKPNYGYGFGGGYGGVNGAPFRGYGVNNLGGYGGQNFGDPFGYGNNEFGASSSSASAQASQFGGGGIGGSQSAASASSQSFGL